MSATGSRGVAVDSDAPDGAEDVQRWLARVTGVSGRRPRRTLHLTLWADDAGARAAMRRAYPLWQSGGTDGDIYGELTEEFGVVTFRGRIEPRGGARVTTFRFGDIDRAIVTDITARPRKRRRVRVVRSGA